MKCEVFIMSEKSEAKAEKAPSKDAYVSKYVRISKIKEILKDGEGENVVSIRVSSDAKPKVAQYLDEAVEKAVKELINKIPRKSKGDAKGELKRITILPEDFKTE